MINFGKVVDARVWGITTQIDDCRLPIGDSSGGTFTGKANPLRGTLLWDQCLYILTGVSVGGNATGGSFTVTIETDAIAGYTALPIARATLGPISPTTVVMDNLHHAPCSPVPTHLNINATIATPGSTQSVRLQCHAIAKQYRGALSTQGNKTAERVLQGSFVGPAQYTTDTTMVLGITDTNIGMGNMRLWDNAMFWFISGATTTGTWDADMIGTIGGKTVSIASTGAAGTMTAIGDKLALVNNFYGQAVNPTHVIITEVSAGTLSSGEVVGIAKSGRGSMGKR